MINKNARFGSYYKEYRALTFLDMIYAHGQTKEVRL
jgi:hypothetical protein